MCESWHLLYNTKDLARVVASPFQKEVICFIKKTNEKAFCMCLCSYLVLLEARLRPYQFPTVGTCFVD